MKNDLVDRVRESNDGVIDSVSSCLREMAYLTVPFIETYADFKRLRALSCSTRKFVQQLAGDIMLDFGRSLFWLYPGYRYVKIAVDIMYEGPSQIYLAAAE